MLSLSVVEVRVKVPSPVDNHCGIPKVRVSSKDCLCTQDLDTLMVNVSDPPSALQMQEVSSPLSSCVSSSPMPESYQFSLEESSTDRVGDVLDTATRPRNLQSKRVMSL